MTKQWKDGLPPVGELCECRPKGHKNAPFYKVTINYISNQVFVATKETGKNEIHNEIEAFEFRPISTEQDEKQALTEILINKKYCSCEWLVDFILERESKLKDKIAELEKVIPFLDSCVDCCFNGFNYDGADMQDHLTELGILVIEPYDPAKHGYCEHGSEEGDDYYVLSSFWGKKLNKNNLKR